MRVVIVGAGGHGMVICDLVRAMGISVIAFVDDDVAKHGKRVLDVPVVAALDDISDRDGMRIALGIGDNAHRRVWYQRLQARGFEFLQLVHPSAIISSGARIRSGAVIMPNVVVNVAAEIGENAILNTACSIDHHSVIGDHAHIAPGATIAGGVRIGEQALVGAGAVIMPGVSLGSRSILGAGAVAVHDLPDDTTCVGVPARPLRRTVGERPRHA